MASTQGNTTDFDSARLKLAHSSNSLQSNRPASKDYSSLTTLQQGLILSLQTSLEVERVLELFFQALRDFLAIDSLEYHNDDPALHIQFGEQAVHRCNYRMSHAGDRLGEIRFSRRRRFGEAQLANLEALLGNLLYPLRNALLYRQAVSSALNDSLTGTGNRLALNQSIEREIQLSIRHRTPLSVLILDIDHFKQINDRFGHTYGDEALKAMVNCTRSCLRAVDGLFRMGGEEFVVLLHDTDSENAYRVAERIRSSIENMQFTLDGQSIPMTVSLGMATRRHDETSRDLLNRCDKLMYQAKQAGRNQTMPNCA